jgi:hypothetical protein
VADILIVGPLTSGHTTDVGCDLRKACRV